MLVLGALKEVRVDEVAMAIDVSSPSHENASKIVDPEQQCSCATACEIATSDLQAFESKNDTRMEEANVWRQYFTKMMDVFKRKAAEREEQRKEIEEMWKREDAELEEERKRKAADREEKRKQEAAEREEKRKQKAAEREEEWKRKWGEMEDDTRRRVA
jgi:Skp family chaperone for outer membrane proteins